MFREVIHLENRYIEVQANSVPAVAVIQNVWALLSVIGFKRFVGVFGKEV